ncbi:hypothetical protein [Microbacterium sp. CGR1]|uniref:hypothetical protein n=1 Tax=Microbacterium sp. CGR1 TaxID=1696072 RepID=UPI003DA1D0B8
MYGPPRAIDLAFGRPAPTIAYEVPLVIVWIVVASILVTVLSGELAIVNNEVAALRAGPGFAVGVAILAVTLAIAQGFGITAATLAVIAASDGRSMTVREAWRGALRRPGSVAIAGLMLLALMGIVLLVTSFAAIMPVVGIVAGIVLLVVGIILAPLLLAWPLVVTRRKSLPAALAWGWRSPRLFRGQMAEPLGNPRLAVVVTIVLTGVIALVVSWLAGLLPAGWWTPSVGAVLAIVPLSVVQLLLAAVSVRGAALRIDEPLLAAASDAEAAPLERRRGTLIGAAALAVPAVVAALLVAVNPWQIPAYAAADVHRVWNSSQIVSWQGGTVVLSRLGGEDSFARVCAGDNCGPEHEMLSILPTAIAPAADGGVLSASWYPIEGADEQSGSFELRVTHSSPESLATWSESLGDDASDAEKSDGWSGFPGDERVLGGIDSTFRSATSVFNRGNQSLMAVAIDSSGDAPVIASIVRPLESRTATIALDFCADAGCTASERTTQEVQWASWSTNSTTLDVASTGDGGSAVVTLTDRGEDEEDIPLRVLTASPEGEWATSVLDAEVPGDAVTDLDQTHGAQVAIGADGLPVVLFRAVDRSTLRLFSCADASCSTASITDIPAETDLLHTPALAIDSSGRPLIATIDRAVNVALLSCGDAACESRTSIPVLAAAPTDGGFSHGLALAVDDEDRPLIAVGLRRAGSEAKATSSGTVVACTAPRCGGE